MAVAAREWTERLVKASWLSEFCGCAGDDHSSIRRSRGWISLVSCQHMILCCVFPCCIIDPNGIDWWRRTLRASTIGLFCIYRQLCSNERKEAILGVDPLVPSRPEGLEKQTTRGSATVRVALPDHMRCVLKRTHHLASNNDPGGPTIGESAAGVPRCLLFHRFRFCHETGMRNVGGLTREKRQIWFLGGRNQREKLGAVGHPES